MYKTKHGNWCDDVPNLVGDIKIVCFSLFVCLFTSLFAPHVLLSRKRKMVQSWFQNCSEIRTVTWKVIWLWKLQFTICLFHSAPPNMCSTVIHHLIHICQPSWASVAHNYQQWRFWLKICHFWAISEMRPMVQNVKWYPIRDCWNHLN